MRRAIEVEWEDGPIEVVFRKLSSRQNRKCRLAAKSKGKLDPWLYMELRAKRQILSVGGEPFHESMLHEWPEEFGMLLFHSLTRGEEKELRSMMDDANL